MNANRLLNAYRSAKLRVALKTGRAQLGRVPGAVVNVDVPVEARISMKVIRADGTVEDHGVIGEGTADVPPQYLDELRQQAGG